MRVQIADLIIRFETESESESGSLKAFFKYHVTDTDQPEDCTVVLKRQTAFYMPKDAQILWQSRRQGIEEPEGQLGRRRIAVSSKLEPFGIASCYVSRTRDTYYYGQMRDNTWISYCPSTRRIDYILRPTVDVISAMPLLMHVVATTHGRYLFHGGAVALNGKAHLFLGKSGSGKSTLSTDLAQRKAAFMSDDLVLVYIRDGVPMVGSLLFRAKLYMESAEEKSEIDIPAAMQTGYCLSAPLEAVYLVQQSGEEISRLEKRPADELLQQLMEASNDMSMQYDKQQWLAMLFELSERLPYYIFHFGNRATLDPSILLT